MIKKVIHELKSGKGIIKTDQKKILAELIDYYKQLSNYIQEAIVPNH